MRLLDNVYGAPQALVYEGVECSGPRIWRVWCADCGDGVTVHPTTDVNGLPQYGLRLIVVDDKEAALRVLAGKAPRGWICERCVRTYELNRA